MANKEIVNDEKVNAIQLPEYLNEQLEEIFRTFDTDGKSIVRQEIMDKFNPEEGSEVAQLFENMDTASDGVISLEEFTFYWKSQVSLGSSPESISQQLTNLMAKVQF